MPEMTFEGTASWKSGTECDLTIKGKHLVTVSPPPSFGGKEGYCVPEDIFAAALASCMNTLFLLISKNSMLELKNLDTKANVKMNVEGMEKLIKTLEDYIHRYPDQWYNFFDYWKDNKIKRVGVGDLKI